MQFIKARILNKIIKDYITLKYITCKYLYNLLEFLCIENSENQQYLFKYILLFRKHLGFGNFVSKFLKACIFNNLYLLHGLFNIDYFEQSEIFQIDFTTEYAVKNNKGLSIFAEIIRQLRKFEPYSKPMLLDLLASFCSTPSSIIHVNQNEIFEKIINSGYADLIFLNIYEANNELILEIY